MTRRLPQPIFQQCLYNVSSVLYCSSIANNALFIRQSRISIHSSSQRCRLLWASTRSDEMQRPVRNESFSVKRHLIYVAVRLQQEVIVYFVLSDSNLFFLFWNQRGTFDGFQPLMFHTSSDQQSTTGRRTISITFQKESQVTDDWAVSPLIAASMHQYNKRLHLIDYFILLKWKSRETHKKTLYKLNISTLRDFGTTHTQQNFISLQGGHRIRAGQCSTSLAGL